MARYKYKDEARWNMIEAREELGISVYEVADDTGYSAQVIRSAEAGRLYIGEKLYSKGHKFFEIMAAYYGLTPEECMKQGKD